MDWKRAGRAVAWKSRRDPSAAMNPATLVAAFGGLLVAVGLVRDPEGKGGWWGLGAWVFFGLIVAAVGLAASVAIFLDSARDRYREESFRHRLTTLASNGRVFLERINGSEGTDCPTTAIDAWGSDVRALLDEMDPTGVYTQRFDIAAGLPHAEPPTRVHGNARVYWRFLRNRLARMGELMRESER